MLPDLGEMRKVIVSDSDASEPLAWRSIHPLYADNESQKIFPVQAVALMVASPGVKAGRAVVARGGLRGWQPAKDVLTGLTENLIVPIKHTVHGEHQLVKTSLIKGGADNRVAFVLLSDEAARFKQVVDGHGACHYQLLGSGDGAKCLCTRCGQR
jgi:hypothetical protein